MLLSHTCDAIGSIYPGPWDYEEAEGKMQNLAAVGASISKTRGLL